MHIKNLFIKFYLPFNCNILFLSLFCIFILSNTLIPNTIIGPGWFDEEIEPNPPGGSGGEIESPISNTYVTSADEVTPMIADLARSLQHDEKLIFEFVRNNIEYSHYKGLKKGAHYTLIEGSGNDFDQCALLMALLDASGFVDASYQFGSIKIPMESADNKDVEHWLNIDPLMHTGQLSGYLANGGFYNYINNTHINIDRVWIKLSISNTDYLLDPSFKQHEVITGLDKDTFKTLSQYNRNELLVEAGGNIPIDMPYAISDINEAALNEKLNDYSINLINKFKELYPNSSIEDIIGGYRIIPEYYETLPTEILYIDTNNPVEWAKGNIPATYAISITYKLFDDDDNLINMRDNLGNIITEKSFFFSDLQCRRLSITFENNLTKIWLDDEVFLEEVTATANNKVKLYTKFNFPSYQDNIYYYKDSSYAIYYGTNPFGKFIEKRHEQLDKYKLSGLGNTTREVTTEALFITGLKFLRETELISQLFSKLNNIIRLTVDSEFQVVLWGAIQVINLIPMNLKKVKTQKKKIQINMLKA